MHVCVPDSNMVIQDAQLQLRGSKHTIWTLFWVDMGVREECVEIGRLTQKITSLCSLKVVTYQLRLNKKKQAWYENVCLQYGD